MKLNIKSHVKRRGEIYHFEATVSKGRRIRESLHTSDTQEARERADKRIRQILAEMPEPPKAGVIRLSDYLKQYSDWADKAKAKKTRETESGVIKSFLRLMPDVVYLHDITTEKADRYVTDRKAECRSIETAKSSLRIMRQVFNKAVFWKKMTENPFTEIRMPKAAPLIVGQATPETRGRILSDEELSRILAEVRQRYARYYPAIVVLAWTGMRRSELLRLHRSQCNFDQAFIDMDKYRTKTGLPRLVPMLDIVSSTLKARPDEWLFADMKADKISEKFEKAIRWINKSNSPIGKVTLTDLRSTFEVYLIRCGISPKIAAMILGHSERISGQFYLGVPIDFVNKKIQDGDVRERSFLIPNSP